MKQSHRLVALLALGVAASAEVDLPRLLKSIEDRYNRPRTLAIRFEQTYGARGRARRVESGIVYLRKPGRMRWEYSDPPGKLFVSDGKDTFFYSPSANRAEKMKLKETDDLRAPLAFLLGKLDFRRDFARFETRSEGTDTVVVALPKSDRLPYTRVEFSVNAQHQIRTLNITGQDQSIMEFRFSDEKLNPPLADETFRFRPPPGVEVVEGVDR